MSRTDVQSAVNIPEQDARSLPGAPDTSSGPDAPDPDAVALTREVADEPSVRSVRIAADRARARAMFVELNDLPEGDPRRAACGTSSSRSTSPSWSTSLAGSVTGVSRSTT